MRERKRQLTSNRRGKITLKVKCSVILGSWFERGIKMVLKEVEMVLKEVEMEM